MKVDHHKVKSDDIRLSPLLTTGIRPTSMVLIPKTYIQQPPEIHSKFPMRRDVTTYNTILNNKLIYRICFRTLYKEVQISHHKARINFTKADVFFFLSTSHNNVAIASPCRCKSANCFSSPILLSKPNYKLICMNEALS